jgi:hypothetical protein
MVLQEKTPFHQAAWVGDCFDIQLYDYAAEDMKVDRLVGVALELEKEVFMIRKSVQRMETRRWIVGGARSD